MDLFKRIQDLSALYDDDGPSAMVPESRPMFNDGGMLVQPSDDGSRPGYAKSKKKKISNTEGLEKLVKQDKITNKNVQNWTTKWIKQNAKNYNIRQFDKFKKNMAKDWSKEIKNQKKYNPFRINITTSDGLPNARGLNINGVTTPLKKDPTLGFEKIFYDQMFKDKDFKKKVVEYLDFVNTDKRFGSVRDDLVAQGKIATDADGKAFFKKSSGSKKAYLQYAKFIDEDVVYFFGDVLNSRRLWNNNPASLNIYSIIEKNTPPKKIQKYRKKLSTAYSSWMNNLKEVADLAGMDFNKVLEMQYNEAAKMKKVFNVKELPFDFQYAQDHLYGLAEAKELGDPKIAKQTLKNLVATTKAQNAYLGTKGFTQKRTKLIRDFKNAPLENKANIVNQLNTLAEEYVPGRLQYNVKKDGSLKITNLQPESTFKLRQGAYKNIAQTFPKDIKKLMAKKLADSGFECRLANGINCNDPKAYAQSIKENMAKVQQGDNASVAKVNKLGKAMNGFKGAAKFTGWGLLTELGFAAPLAAVDYAKGANKDEIISNATYGLFGKSEEEQLKEKYADYGQAQKFQDTYDKLLNQESALDDQTGYGPIINPQNIENTEKKLIEQSKAFNTILPPSMGFKGDFDLDMFFNAQALDQKRREEFAKEKEQRSKEIGILKPSTGLEAVELAGGGIAKMAGDRSGAMTRSMNPDSQGLSYLFNRVKKV